MSSHPAGSGAAAETGPAAPRLHPAMSLTESLPGLLAAFSTALPRQPDAALAPQARALAAQSWGEAPAPTPLLLRQTHSPHVLHLDGALHAGNGAGPASDGSSPAFDGAAAASRSGHLLAVKTADCVPLLAVDAELGRYAALHAGWRGTATGILESLLDTWRAGGSSLRAVRVELGPHIQGCCYAVRADCLEQFTTADLDGAVRAYGERTHLHLAAVLRTRAVRAGVPDAHVVVSPHCTYCHRDAAGHAPYASYRRATHADTPFDATNVALIGVRPAPRKRV